MINPKIFSFLRTKQVILNSPEPARVANQNDNDKDNYSAPLP